MPNNEHTYSLRHLPQFKTPSVNIVYHGRKSVEDQKFGKFYPIALKRLTIEILLLTQLKLGNLVISLADFVGYMFKHSLEL